MFNLSAPFQQLSLTKFGGLYLIADARDLPSGASPLCYDVDFVIAGVEIRPGLVQALALPSGAGSVSWLKADTIANKLVLVTQDSVHGVTFTDLDAATTVTPTNVVINSPRAISLTAQQREYVGYSDLSIGSSQPWFYPGAGASIERVSQVGPGQAPSVSTSSLTAHSIDSISMLYSAVNLNSVSWGSTINLYTAQPASTTITFLSPVSSTTWRGDLAVGDTVYVSGNAGLDGQNPNGTYTVTAIGTYSDHDGARQYFQVTSPISNSDFARNTSAGTWQKTNALILMTAKGAFNSNEIAIGDKISVSGNSVQGWNTSWPITDLLSEGNLNISNTLVSGSTIIYSYTTQSGTAPGWQPSFAYSIGTMIVDNNASSHVWMVTAVQGNAQSGSSEPSFPSSPSGPVTDNNVTWTYQSGITLPVTLFNLVNGTNVEGAIITSATTTTFTVASSGSPLSGPEQGQAVSGSGISIAIDPGTPDIGSGNPGSDPIFSTGTGGTAAVSEATPQLSPGPRYAVVMFQTDQGYITPASPPVLFYTGGESTSVTFNNIPTGPANVIQRIIAITPANGSIGGPYYYLPTEIILTVNQAAGQPLTVSATVVNDNVSTSSGPLTITDAALLNGINISITGNNLQQEREVGEFVKCSWYHERMFYLGERTKVDLLQNMTFDGGVASNGNAIAGWTATGNAYPYFSIVPSPVVNNSLQISVPSAATSISIIVETQGGGITASSFTATVSSLNLAAGQYALALISVQSGVTSPPYTAATLPSAPAGWSLLKTYTAGTIAIGVYAHTITGVSDDTWTFDVPSGSQFSTSYVVNVYNASGPLSYASGSAIFDVAAEEIQFQLPAVTAGCLTALLSVADVNNICSSTSNYSPAAINGVTGGFSGPSWPIFSFSGDETASAQSASINVVGLTSSFTGIPPQFSLYVSVSINGGGTLGSDSVLSQPAAVNFANVPIILPNVAYSVRVAASLISGSAGTATINVGLSSVSAGASWIFSINATSLGATMVEFSGALNNPLWATVPSDLQFKIYTTNFTGLTVLIDRIELYPTEQPAYAQQCYGSYLGNPMAVDAVTGPIDSSAYTNEVQTNVFTFLDHLYITTATKTFQPVDTAEEPALWGLQEISNAVGAVGPLAVAVSEGQVEGEEYAIQCSRDGVYMFDGGNHVKISQEIQPLWDAIYWASAKTIWVKNDINNQRLLIGIPLPTPNTWLPNAPTNSTPTTPNVILVCSYLGLLSGREIAGAQSVHVSMFTGNMLYRDISRKWTVWNVGAEYANFIRQVAGNAPLWLAGSGQLNSFSDTAYTDLGAAITPTYYTFGMSDPMWEEQHQLQSVRKIYGYAALTIEGAGSVVLTGYPETLATTLPLVALKRPLENPALDDLNFPLNYSGNRCFMKLTTDGVAGSWWALRRFVIGIIANMRIPISGR